MLLTRGSQASTIIQAEWIANTPMEEYQIQQPFQSILWNRILPLLNNLDHYRLRIGQIPVPASQLHLHQLVAQPVSISASLKLPMPQRTCIKQTHDQHTECQHYYKRERKGNKIILRKSYTSVGVKVTQKGWWLLWLQVIMERQQNINIRTFREVPKFVPCWKAAGTDI